MEQTGTTLQLKTYTNTANMSGNNSSRGIYQCLWEDRLDERTALLGEADPYDPDLIVQEVEIAFLQDDASCGYAQLTVTSNAADSNKTMHIDDPPKVSWEVSAEALTISGNAVWKDGTGQYPAVKNKDTKATIRIPLIKLKLEGIKSSWSLANIVNHIGRINSDVFQGAPAKTLLFNDFQAQTRPDGKFHVEYDLLYKPTSWVKFWREDKAGGPGWEEIGLGPAGGTSPYELVAFSNLWSS